MSADVNDDIIALPSFSGVGGRLPSGGGLTGGNDAAAPNIDPLIPRTRLWSVPPEVCVDVVKWDEPDMDDNRFEVAVTAAEDDGVGGYLNIVVIVFGEQVGETSRSPILPPSESFVRANARTNVACIAGGV